MYEHHNQPLLFIQSSGSLIFAVEKAAFWGVSVRALAERSYPKMRGIITEIPKQSNFLRVYDARFLSFALLRISLGITKFLYRIKRSER